MKTFRGTYQLDSTSEVRHCTVLKSREFRMGIYFNPDSAPSFLVEIQSLYLCQAYSPFSATLTPVSSSYVLYCSNSYSDLLSSKWYYEYLDEQWNEWSSRVPRMLSNRRREFIFIYRMWKGWKHTHTGKLATALAVRSLDLNHGMAKLHFLSSSYLFYNIVTRLFNRNRQITYTVMGIWSYGEIRHFYICTSVRFGFYFMWALYRRKLMKRNKEWEWRE